MAGVLFRTSKKKDVIHEVMTDRSTIHQIVSKMMVKNGKNMASVLGGFVHFITSLVSL